MKRSTVTIRTMDQLERTYFPRSWRKKHPPRRVGTGFAEDFMRRLTAALGRARR